jgi:hypothetical protein
VFRGKAAFAGWGFAEGGLREVNLYVDSRYVGTATRGIPRPDVAAAFPGIADAKTSGWQIGLDTTGISVGRHDFTVQGIAESGAVKEFGTITAEVVKP